MYARINIPVGYVGSSKETMIALQSAVDAANNAHVVAKDAAAHIAADRKLHQTITEIESRISGDDYGDRASIRAALTSVRDAVRTRLISVGQSPQALGEQQTSLSRMIAQLPDVAAERLASALIEYGSNQAALNTALRNLFAIGDKSQAAIMWRDYLNGPPQHTITYLGGSNIINFKVATVPAGIEPSEVLKLEYRFGYARRMDTVVRKAVPGLFTPTSAVRMVMTPKHQGVSATGRSLMVTTLCAYGGADGYAERLRRIAAAPGGSTTVFALETQDIAAQMCTALQNFEANNIYFPDAKLSNWVVDAPRKLQIADTKSFLHSPPNHFNPAHPDNCGKMMTLATYGYVSNEVFNNLATPTQIHSAILGRNIYNFLTGVNPNDVYPPLCNEPFFAGPSGELYKALIVDLTRNPASTRITLAEAGQRLRMIELILDPLYTAIKAKIHDLEIQTGKNYNHCFAESIRAACIAPGYKKDAVLLALSDAASKALASARAAQTSRTLIIKASPMFGGKEVLPTALLKTDQDASINTAVDLNMLAAGWETHAMHLRAAESALTHFQTMQALAVQCNKRGFGTEDAEINKFLADAKLEALGGANISERLIRAERVMTRLNDLQATLYNPEMSTVHQLIANLRVMDKLYPYVGAKNIAAAVETAAAALPIAVRKDPMANLADPAVQKLNEVMTMANLMLHPTYLAFADKIKQLEGLIGKEYSICLFENITAVSRNVNYDPVATLAALGVVVDKTLASAQSASLVFKEISKSQCSFGGKILFPDDLMLADLKSCIGEPVNLNTLSQGLARFEAHLAMVQASLPHLIKLQGLGNACRIQRFGKELDIKTAAYLCEAVQFVTKDKDLISRLTSAYQARAELVRMSEWLKKPGINEIHRVIQDLRDTDIKANKAKADAIEAAALEIPINIRANLEGNLQEHSVRVLFNALASSYSPGGLGAAADPSQSLEYQRVLKAIQGVPVVMAPNDEAEPSKRLDM